MYDVSALYPCHPCGLSLSSLASLSSSLCSCECENKNVSACVMTFVTNQNRFPVPRNICPGARSIVFVNICTVNMITCHTVNVTEKKKEKLWFYCTVLYKYSVT